MDVVYLLFREDLQLRLELHRSPPAWDMLPMLGSPVAKSRLAWPGHLLSNGTDLRACRQLPRCQGQERDLHRRCTHRPQRRLWKLSACHRGAMIQQSARSVKKPIDRDGGGPTAERLLDVPSQCGDWENLGG